jgi:ABC-type uncharacterized transport system permease subunit
MSDSREKELDLLMNLLQIRTDSLVNYSNRVWLIFNWFVTLNIGVLGFFLTKQATDFTISIIIVGFLSSMLWFMIGIQDFKSMEKHKLIKKEVEKIVLGQLDQPTLNKVMFPEKEKFEFQQTWSLFAVPIVFAFIWILFFYTNFPLR